MNCMILAPGVQLVHGMMVCFYNSCAFYSCNMFKTFIITNFYESQLLHVKFFHVLSEVIFMPFKYGLIFEETNIVHKIILYKFSVFSLVYKFKYIYLFILFALLIKTLMRGNYFLLNLLLIFLYLNFIFTLQIQIRHFFFPRRVITDNINYFSYRVF